MKILVTGGAGFIGSAIAQRLNSEGHTVVVIDDFNPYYDVNLKRARAQFLLEGVTVVEGSILDEHFLDTLFSREKFDVVCHLAAQAGVRYSFENPQIYVDTNVKGTQLLLEAMHTHGVGRLVYASTSSIYGNEAPSPFKEDYHAYKPVSIYAATKQAGELLAYTYASLYGMQVTSLRFFTVYGPWGRPDMALFKFTNAMLKGEPIPVYNNGQHRRDFTYIDDIVSGFVAAVATPLQYEIINLGNGAPTELMDFIGLLEKELGLVAQKEMLPMQVGDVFETYADTSKAQELLNFKAEVPVAEGVHRFVEWYRDFYKQ